MTQFLCSLNYLSADCELFDVVMDDTACWEGENFPTEFYYGWERYYAET